MSSSSSSALLLEASEGLAAATALSVLQSQSEVFKVPQVILHAMLFGYHHLVSGVGPMKEVRVAA